MPPTTQKRSLGSIARALYKGLLTRISRVRVAFALAVLPSWVARTAPPQLMQGEDSWRAVDSLGSDSPIRSSVPRDLLALARKAGGLVELPTRSVADWTPSSVQAALESADDGMLERPADLVEALMRDDRVQGVLGTRTFGLLGLPKAFFGEKDQVSRLEGQKDSEGRVSTPGEFDQMLPEAELGKLLMWGILLGVGLGELVPQDDRAVGDRIVPRLKIWHPRYLRYDWYEDKWLLTHSMGETEIKPGDGRWVLYLPYGTHRPWVYGAWRPCAFAFALKLFALHDRARASEVYGSPVRWGSVPKGTPDPDKARWLRELRNLGRDTAMVSEKGAEGDGYDLKYVEATGQTFKIYEDSVTWADRAIAIALAGQAVTTEGTKGFSNGNIHAAVLEHLIEFTARSLEACIHEQVLRPLANLNDGDANQAAYVRWDTVPPEDKLTYANALVQLGNAIKSSNEQLAAYGKRINAIAMMHKFGVSLEELPIQSTTAPSVQLAPTDAVKVIRLDEARAGMGLQAWDVPLEGKMTVADFSAAREAARIAQAQAQAELGTPPVLQQKEAA